MKTILITGMNRGLGKELFNLLIAKGYLVFGVLRNEEVATRLAKELPENGRIILCDLSSDECIPSIRAVVKDTPIDLLINNAGIAGSSFRIDDTQSQEIQALFNVHCLGAFRTVKAVRTNLTRAENPSVLNLNSRFGSITRQSEGTYGNIAVSYSYRIAKAAQNMLTNCLRDEFRGRIKFISLHPGKMKTQIAQIDADTEPEMVAAKILQYYENGTFREENGIAQLDNELIEW
ncbi:MAG: SDR family NAD(P)-dependent oxidoreductase [Bacteroidota bacterium]